MKKRSVGKIAGTAAATLAGAYAANRTVGDLGTDGFLWPLIGIAGFGFLHKKYPDQSLGLLVGGAAAFGVQRYTSRDDSDQSESEPTTGIDGVVPPELARAPSVPVPSEFLLVRADGEQEIPCLPTTGYRLGAPVQICLVDIDGALVGAQAGAAFRRMQAAARAAGVTLRIVSGFRTMQRQQELYDLWRSGRTIAVAARPGYSNHQSGIALDLNWRDLGVRPWLLRNAARFGFRRTTRNEPWHYDWLP
jgi:hypothetical protein